MKYILKRAIRINIYGLSFWIVTNLLNFDTNRHNITDLIIITILGELTYWLTIAIGLLFIKK